MKGIFIYLGNNKPDYRSLMREQRDLFLNGRRIPLASVVIAEQTHSDNVHLCSREDSGAGTHGKAQIMDTDGFITNIPNQYLLIRTADCTPVLIYDEHKYVVCALHSGREGTRKNITGRAIEAMCTHYSCNPDHLKFVIGPGICPFHYEVSKKIFDEFTSTFHIEGIPIPRMEGHQIDIQSCIMNQALHAGILPEHISFYNVCTYEAQDYFSFRRDGSKNRQINIIGVYHD